MRENEITIHDPENYCLFNCEKCEKCEIYMFKLLILKVFEPFFLMSFTYFRYLETLCYCYF